MAPVQQRSHEDHRWLIQVLWGVFGVSELVARALPVALVPWLLTGGLR